MSFHVPEALRFHGRPDLESDARDGNNGYFEVVLGVPYRRLFIVASDGEGYEHVSVHVHDGERRQWTPTWEEMCQVKDLFWDEEDVVVQYHPRRSEYVNLHVNTLHLFRPIGVDLPTPPSILVGPLGVTAVTS